MVYFTHYQSFIPKNIPVINSLRGFASVVVCIFHLICLPLNFLEQTFLFQLALFGKYGVQIFFVITGVVITISLIKADYKYSSFGKFMLKRIVRIEPPYLLSIVAALILLVLRNHFSNELHPIPSAKNLLLHVGYLIPFAKQQQWFVIVFWTMAVEFQFYIFISMLYPILLNAKLVARIAGYCLIYGLAIGFKNNEFVLVWLPVFMMGITYAAFRFTKIGVKEFLIILMISVCFSFWLHHIIVTIIALLTIAIIYFYSEYNNILGKFLGRISYSLYLIHTIIGTAFINFLIPHVTGTAGKCMLVLSAFVVSILSAYIFYLVAERPFQMLASKVLLKSKISGKSAAVSFRSASEVK